jgi:hypothetical protein
MQANNGHGEGSDNYYTFQFEHKFEHPNDEVWFAHAVPYTYTTLQTKLKQHVTESPTTFRAEVMAMTVGGLPVPLLTITENVESYITYHEQVAL